MFQRIKQLALKKFHAALDALTGADLECVHGTPRDQACRRCDHYRAVPFGGKPPR